MVHIKICEHYKTSLNFILKMCMTVLFIYKAFLKIKMM